MRWERFPRHRLRRKPPVNNPSMHHGTYVSAICPEAHRSVRSLFGFTNRRSDGLTCVHYDAPTQFIRINTGNAVLSPTWRASPKWRKQKAFPFPGTLVLWVFWKKESKQKQNKTKQRTTTTKINREFPAFFICHGQSYAHRHRTWNSLEYRRKITFDHIRRRLLLKAFRMKFPYPALKFGISGVCLTPVHFVRII